MKAYEREDGLYEAEAHLLDTKPFAFERFLAPDPLPAGAPLHDLSLRIVLDAQLVVRAIEAAADATPFSVCSEATLTLSPLIGLRLASGWSRVVKETLQGPAGCTHLAELLLPLATTALQGIWGLRRSTDEQGANERRQRIDSCYAFAANRDVVRIAWPDRYKGPIE